MTPTNTTSTVKSNALTQEALMKIFLEEKLKAAHNNCYAEEVKKELQRQETDQDNWLTALDLLNAYSVPYKKLSKNGDVEQFYTYCYSNIIIDSTSYLSDLDEHAATILLCKVTDRLLAYAKEGSSTNLEQNVELSLSDQEKHGLKYIGGYIIHKLHKKFKNSKNWRSSDSQQAIALINAGRSSENEKNEAADTLMSKINRGGLWDITDNMENILMTTELFFRNSTQQLSSHKIDIQLILFKSINDSSVKSNLQELCHAAELNVSKNIAKDILFSIVKLYIQIRSFSYARDIMQKYKIGGQCGKAKGLRKEIKRAYSLREISNIKLT